MRNYIGVDWADEEDVVWVVNDAGDKMLSRRVAHTVAARSEWARWLRERQAEGVELWAAIERPHVRIVDFLLDHGVVVYPINPKSWIGRAIPMTKPLLAGRRWLALISMPTQ